MEYFKVIATVVCLDLISGKKHIYTLVYKPMSSKTQRCDLPYIKTSCPNLGVVRTSDSRRLSTLAEEDHKEYREGSNDTKYVVLDTLFFLSYAPEIPI